MSWLRQEPESDEGSTADEGLPPRGTAAVKLAGGARPLGIAKQSATKMPELAKSSGGAGPSWSRAYGKSAADAAAVKSACETRSSRIVKYSVTSEPERKDNILGRNQTRLELWEGHLKDPIVPLDKAVSRLPIGSRPFVDSVLSGLRPSGLRHGAKDLERAVVGKGVALFWIRGTACVCAQRPRIGTFQGSVDRTVSSSSFLLKKEPMVLK